MAHRALTPRLLVVFRLAPSDGDVSAPEEKTEDSGGAESHLRKPCSSGGLESIINMSVMGITPELQPQPTQVLFPLPQGLGQAPWHFGTPFCISNFGMVVTVASKSCL